MVTLSSILSEFVGIFLHNDCILQLDLEKIVGYLWIGLCNLFWNTFGAVRDLVLCLRRGYLKG